MGLLGFFCVCWFEMILNSLATAGYIQILKQMMYGWRKTKEKGERFLRKRKRGTGKRVWRCKASHYQLTQLELM